MNELEIIRVSQLGVNDEKAILIEWSAPEGEKVYIGDTLCVLETTKAAYDIEAEISGYISYIATEGDHVFVDQPLAIIAKTLQDAISAKKTYEDKIEKERKINESEIISTAKARNLAFKDGIDLNDIQPSSGKVVRVSDVIKYKLHHQSKIQKEPNLNIVEGFIPVIVYGAGNGGVTIQEALALGDVYRAVCFVDDHDHYLSP